MQTPAGSDKIEVSIILFNPPLGKARHSGNRRSVRALFRMKGEV
jgi:hypothetical protein